MVDALAVGSLDPLAPLLGAAGPPKILHDAGFDARLLRDAGLVLDDQNAGAHRLWPAWLRNAAHSARS